MLRCHVRDLPRRLQRTDPPDPETMGGVARSRVGLCAEPKGLEALAAVKELRPDHRVGEEEANNDDSHDTRNKY